MNFLSPNKLFLILVGILFFTDVKSQEISLLSKSAKTASHCWRKPPLNFISVGGGFGNKPSLFVEDVSIRIENEFGSATPQPKNHFYFLVGKRFLVFFNTKRRIIDVGIGARVENFTSKFSNNNFGSISNKNFLTGIITTNYTYYFSNFNFSSPFVSGGINLQFNNLFYRDGITLFETRQKWKLRFFKPNTC